jgi:hypothetical protein
MQQYAATVDDAVDNATQPTGSVKRNKKESYRAFHLVRDAHFGSDPTDDDNSLESQENNPRRNLQSHMNRARPLPTLFITSIYRAHILSLAWPCLACFFTSGMIPEARRLHPAAAVTAAALQFPHRSLPRQGSKVRSIMLKHVLEKKTRSSGGRVRGKMYPLARDVRTSSGNSRRWKLF